MAVNPITVADRLKTFVLMGHSNADGYAPILALINSYPIFQPKATSVLVPDAENYYKNIYVATSAQPWAGTAGTPVDSEPGDVEWLEMTTNLPVTPNDAHPHSSPYNYPNVRGSCVPAWHHGARLGSLSNINGSVFIGTFVGLETPLSVHWQHHWQEQVGIVKVAQGASLFLRYEPGGPVAFLNENEATPADAQFQPGSVDITQYNHFAYWTPSDEFDFAPATDRFYKVWYDKMVGASNALPGGVKMDVRLIVPWMGDNDSDNREQAELEPNFEKAVRSFVKRIRQDCVDNDWTSLPAEQIPIVWPGIFTLYTGPSDSPGFSSVDFCNAALQRIAADDPYFRWVDTSEFSTLEDEGFTGFATNTGNMNNHFGPIGYVQAAAAIYEAYLDIEADGADTLDDDDKLTVAQVFERTRVYYNRSRTQTDMGDDHLFIHLNGALDSMLNAIGDNAYWLRRRETFTMTQDEDNTVNVCTLPKIIGRLLKVEDPTNACYPLKWELVGRTSTGKLQISLREIRSGGTFMLHYILRPKEVTKTEQFVPIPRQIAEWLVVETAHRFSMGGSNIAQQAVFGGLAAQLRERSIKELQVQERGKFDRMYTTRRWPNVRYRRQGKTTWDRI